MAINRSWIWVHVAWLLVIAAPSQATVAAEDESAPGLKLKTRARVSSDDETGKYLAFLQWIESRPNY